LLETNSQNNGCKNLSTGIRGDPGPGGSDKTEGVGRRGFLYQPKPFAYRTTLKSRIFYISLAITARAEDHTDPFWIKEFFFHRLPPEAFLSFTEDYKIGARGKNQGLLPC
jgi:hypothetical protein